MLQQTQESGRHKARLSGNGMVNVLFENDGIDWYITLKGHAEYAPAGSDIVCAACSILCDTLLCTLNGMKMDKLIHSYSSSAFDGYMKIVVRMNKKRGKALLPIYMAATGFQLLAESYPEHVGFKLFSKQGRNKFSSTV